MTTRTKRSPTKSPAQSERATLASTHGRTYQSHIIELLTRTARDLNPDRNARNAPPEVGLAFFWQECKKYATARLKSTLDKLEKDKLISPRPDDTRVAALIDTPHFVITEEIRSPSFRLDEKALLDNLVAHGINIQVARDLIEQSKLPNKAPIIRKIEEK